MADNYQHLQNDCIYSEINIPGPGANMDDFSVQYAKGCDCQYGNCASVNICPCVARYGPNYTSDNPRLLLDCKFNGPIVECNSECVCYVEGRSCENDLIPCSESEISCNNRKVQFGPRKDLEIFVTLNKGYGLRCSNFIPKGSFICEYAGEVIGSKEAKARSEKNQENMNYIFVLKEHVGVSQVVIKTCVDPTKIGNIGRYINHSCDPNTAIIPVRVDNPVPRLAIFAIDDILVGDEITFNYGGVQEDHGENWPVKNARTCFCGAVGCKKFLPFDKDLF